MKLNIYTVYDEKAQAYLQPFFTQAHGLARRMFSDSINDPNHHFNRHAADYTLFHIGTYDDADAQLDAHIPTCLGNGVEYKETN